MSNLYIKPTVKKEVIKINYFMTNVSFWEQFGVVGDVYAQSGSTTGGDSGYVGDSYGSSDSGYDSGYSSGDSGYGNDSYGVDSYGADDYGASEGDGSYEADNAQMGIS